MTREDNMQIISNLLSPEAVRRIVEKNYSDDVIEYISGYAPTAETFSSTKYKAETVEKLMGLMREGKIDNYDMMELMEDSLSHDRNERYVDKFAETVSMENHHDTYAVFRTTNVTDVSFDDMYLGIHQGVYEANNIGEVQRNKDLARNSLIYATMSTLLGLLMIMYGTNGIGYGKILFPISYFVFVSLIFKLLDRYAYKVQRGIALCGLILFATFSIFSAYADKMSANREVEEKQIVLEANRTSTCIYFRQHARGYKDAVLLMDYFERAQTINVDTENWQDLVEYDGVDSEIICYFTDESECAKAWEFVNSLGYNSIESIFDNDDTHIYMVSK